MVLCMSCDFSLYLEHFKYYFVRLWALFILILLVVLLILMFFPKLPASIYISDFSNRCPYILSRSHS